ncbi:rho GTPase-activating protein gacJ-like [Helicoverpa armigera]|uniref:rho GTPase-activating protein gacJ-like n=2 Tax=Helicoverpa armigera TaxID=29058 RepID=UPI0030835E05
MFKIVLFITFTVLCVVNTQSDDGCNHSRSYTRVKRGKYYNSPPLRFYNRPPYTIPIKGPFSYTPPPFMKDDEPPYPGSRPYKVSKPRPTNDGLADDDINNLVKHLSKQDLDKIIEFASGKNQVADYEHSRPYKRENSNRTPYTKEFYRGNDDTKYREEKPYETELKKYVNYVTEATPMKYAPQTDSPYPSDTEPNHVSYYGPQNVEYDTPPPDFRPQDDRPFKSSPSDNGPPTQYKPFFSQAESSQFKVYGPQNGLGASNEESLINQNIGNPQAPPTYSDTSDPSLHEMTEEEKLPPPINMREIDFDVSYTNNVPTVVKADSSSYQVESFGDLPLMNYNSKLHSVSSYHVPHYTVTHTKSQSLPSPPVSTSFSSSSSYSSSSLLKPSPAAASVKAPPVEPAPPPSAAKEQSDAHLKATKIWSHRSKGAAYTLHDDGTLTPEWPRPKYG